MMALRMEMLDWTLSRGAGRGGGSAALGSSWVLAGSLVFHVTFGQEIPAELKVRGKTDLAPMGIFN